MRIRFFNTYDTVAPFLRNLVPFLASRGHHVQVVTSRALYRSSGDLRKTVGGWDGVEVKLMPNYGLNVKRTFAKALVMLSYHVNTWLYTIFGPKVDYNIFLTEPPLISLLGFTLSKIRRQPYYCVVMDIYPDMAVELGMMPSDGLQTKVMRYLARLPLRHATKVISTGRCMTDYLKELGVSEELIEMVPNWADEKIIFPVPHAENELRKDQGWEDKFIVLYAGNIGAPQHFDDMIDAAEQMQAYENLRFVFIGGGSREKEVREKVEAKNLSNLIMLPFLHEKYPLSQIVSAGDLHLVTLKESMTGLAIPSKSYAALAGGRPLIYQGKPEAETARMVIEEDIGSVLRPGDVEGFKQAVLEHMNNPELCRIRGQRAYALATGRYSRASCLKKYAKIIESVNLAQPRKELVQT